MKQNYSSLQSLGSTKSIDGSSILCSTLKNNKKKTVNLVSPLNLEAKLKTQYNCL